MTDAGSHRPRSPRDAREPSGRHPHPTNGWVRIAMYWFFRRVTLVICRVLFGLRLEHSAPIPRTGPLLIIANHQSFLDPPVVSHAITARQIDFVARGSLFRSKLFGGLIGALNSLPIEDEGGDTAAMKEILRRLGEGRAVLIFPEGTRTPDGEMRPFKRGISVLLKRAQCPVLPVGISGTFAAWPRDRRRPRVLGGRSIRVVTGVPIAHEDLMKSGPVAALARLQDAVCGLLVDVDSAREPDSGSAARRRD